MLMVAACLVTAPVRAQPAPEKAAHRSPAPTEVSFNLDDADLPELVKAISAITGKRFIYGGKLRGIKATVHAPEKISAAEAYQAFLSILATNGMTVISHGRFFKIVETAGVAAEGTEVYSPSTPVPNEERYVTRLLRLAHADATNVAGMLNKLKSKDADITVHAPGNLLVITDTGANIHRMMQIIQEIDVGDAAAQLWIEPLHYSSAADVSAKLSDLLDLKSQKGGGATTDMRVLPDERGNALLIVATEADYLRLLELIKRLDVKQTGEGQVRVMPLQHASCKELTPTLGQVLGTGGGALPTAAGAAPGRVPGAAGSGVSEVLEGHVRMTCDEATNAVVATASPRDQAQIRALIDKLDRPRRQVFIEATIMDVTVGNTTKIGVSYHAGSAVGSDGTLLYGGSNAMGSAGALSSNLEGLALGIRGPDLPGSGTLLGTGISIPAFGAVLTAMANDGDVNVLATPHILATDNVKAEISIGQNIALQTNVNSAASLASLAGGAGALASLGGALGTNAPRQDVGTRIAVTPHLNDSNEVRLELDEEISESGEPQGDLGAVPINKRAAKTTLVVRDGQTVIVGGLMRDAITNGESKIPVLGDIPLLGRLFKQTTKTKQKTNLLLVLTPTIIRGQEDLRAIFERKMQERQDVIDRYFVFGDDQAWKPPQDYRRSNGLVEDIRQTMRAEDEKRRAELAAAPPAPKTHTPGVPIERPGNGRRAGAGDGAAEKPRGK
ncbi:General secretion pathway protein D / Type II secretion outermembrane pore forming protein (PulD) [Minicystis rosea]|nr:General secretion pathway protein D / Type II secretion outermembrane pore forming protein (PulD) [Minicystis rosea]